MALDVEHLPRGGRGEVAVVATGTYNAIAPSVYQTWAWYRAETTGSVGSPFRLPSGNVLTFARVRQLEPRIFGADRFEALAVQATEQLVPTLRKLPRETRIGFVFCLPLWADARTGTGLGAVVRRRIESRLLVPFIEAGYDVIGRAEARGHAAFAHGVLDVVRMFESDALDVAVIIGVDSHYHPDLLEVLFEDKRVIDADWRDGFIPGEAASAVALARGVVAKELGLERIATLDTVATDHEVATIDNHIGMQGQGLTRPAMEACKRLREEDRYLDWWLSDATGEPLRILELQVVWPRASTHAMHPQSAIDLLPVHFGEIGAATMPTALALGIEGLRRGSPAGRTVVCTGSSDDGARGVVLATVRAPSAARPSSRPPSSGSRGTPHGS